MTVRLYAERKQWPLDGIRVAVHRTPETGPIQSVAVELLLGGDLDAEQRARLHAVAERCPVHRALAEAVPITHPPGAG